MREKGTDFSIARTRYTVNKQKFLQHPMVKRINALAEDGSCRELVRFGYRDFKMRLGSAAR